jgi:hypothetical protein
VADEVSADEEVPSRCNFCEENPPTHFSMDWDAYLCDECEKAQEEEMERVRREFSLKRSEGKPILEALGFEEEKA